MSHNRKRAAGIRAVPSWMLTALVASAGWSGPVAGQDANYLMPIPEIETILREAPLNVVRTQGSRFEGDRTQFVTLRLADGSSINVKWAAAPPGGEAFNNQPRYELAAYELQKLFLDPPEYVVPPTIARVLSLDWYRTLDDRTRATFSNTSSVLVVLQYWLLQVTREGFYDPDRARADTVYARHLGNMNILSHLIYHSDANEGNFLISEYPDNPRVFTVDNGITFRSQASNRGTFWRDLHLDVLPAHTVERLRWLTPDELHERLGVLLQYRVVDGQLVPETPGPNLNPGRGVRTEDGIIQLGLSSREIDEVADRLRRLVERVNGGRILLAGARKPHALPDTGRVEGEHALRVWRDGDSVRVGWLTALADEGVLQVVDGSRVRHDFRTPEGTAHTAAFHHTGGGERLLRYGGASPASATHETLVRLDRPRRPRVSLGAVDSLYVMGDVHGELDTLVAVLRNAGLVDEQERWSGGRRHLALVGDLMDRGQDVSGVLWLLHRLEREADQAGGGVHVLLGNHEIMPLLNDLRYVAPKELVVAERHGVPYHRLYDIRHAVLGTWLASRPAMMRIGSVLLAHGGVAPDQLGVTLQTYDDSLAAFMAEDVFYRWSDTTFVADLDSAAVARRVDFFQGPNSVFWYRGYAQTDSLSEELSAVLDHFDAAVHVFGHTPAETITPYYGGRVIGVNTVPFAAELLLLVGDGTGRLLPFRIRTAGPPERLEAGGR